MKRFRIVHHTTMTYASDVRATHNELRMSPITEAGQTTLENRLRVRPMTWSLVYRDHWGTHVTAMESMTPHKALDIEAISTVERVELPPPAASPGWDVLHDPTLLDRSHEWLAETPRTTPGDHIAALAASVRDRPTPRAAAEALAEGIRDHLTYQDGVTGVHSNAEEAWAEGSGVCQDFAHILIAGLRSLGIPARYVSGYLSPVLEAGVGEVSVGESHAWVEFLDGTWIAIDPTNASSVGLDHLVVARGRDYEDVPPFKGVYAGPPLRSLDVSVTVTRIA